MFSIIMLKLLNHFKTSSTPPAVSVLCLLPLVLDLLGLGVGLLLSPFFLSVEIYRENMETHEFYQRGNKQLWLSTEPMFLITGEIPG